MSNKETGGPAFPVTRDAEAQNDAWGGMTLREYFAAKADIPWEVAAEMVYRQNGNANGTTAQILAKRSQLRFEQADSMLEACK